MLRVSIGTQPFISYSCFHVSCSRDCECEMVDSFFFRFFWGEKRNECRALRVYESESILECHEFAVRVLLLCFIPTSEQQSFSLFCLLPLILVPILFLGFCWCVLYCFFCLAEMENTEWQMKVIFAAKCIFRFLLFACVYTLGLLQTQQWI